MNNFANGIKRNLLNQLEILDGTRSLFVSDPERDFTRKRKLDFQETVRILLSMGGQSLNLELLEYFSYDVETVTKSAFVQRRDKILPEALEQLFHRFTDTIDHSKQLDGYRLLAADGSALCIPFNPNDKDTHFPNGPKAKGFNLLLFYISNRGF